MSDVKEIEAREAKATKGPWATVSDHPVYAIAAGKWRVSQTANQNNYQRFDASHGWHGIESYDDATFIAHAREDIPHLLTLLRDAEAENKRLREAYDEIGNAVLNIMEESEDEGDRIYFGSTNDADMLRSLGSKYHNWRIRALNPEVKP